MQGNPNDPLVVRTDDLVAAISPYVEEQDAVYRAIYSVPDGESGGHRAFRLADPILSGRRMIEERCGLDPRSSLCRRILSADERQRSEWTSLAVADRILCGLGLAMLLCDGTIPVYQSSRYSDETWARLMRERGIEGDPWEELCVRRPSEAPAPALAEAA